MWWAVPVHTHSLPLCVICGNHTHAHAAGQKSEDKSPGEICHNLRCGRDSRRVGNAIEMFNDFHG